MAHQGVKGSATTHVSPQRNGPHRAQRPRSFAYKPSGPARGMPVKGNVAPWFLRSWGTRPRDKSKPALLDVAA